MTTFNDVVLPTVSPATPVGQGTIRPTALPSAGPGPQLTPAAPPQDNGNSAMWIAGLASGLIAGVALLVLFVYLYRRYHREDGRPRMKKNNVAPGNDVSSSIQVNHGDHLDLEAGAGPYETAVLYDETYNGAYEKPQPAYLVPVADQVAFYEANRARGALTATTHYKDLSGEQKQYAYSPLSGNQVYDNGSYETPVPAYKALEGGHSLYGATYGALGEHEIYVVRSNPVYNEAETDADEDKTRAVYAVPMACEDNDTSESDATSTAASDSTGETPTTPVEFYNTSKTLTFFGQARPAAGNGSANSATMRL